METFDEDRDTWPSIEYTIYHAFFTIHIYTQHIYIYIHTCMHTRGFSFYRERLAFRYVETNLQVGKKDYYINNKRSLDDFATRFSNRLIL